MQTRPRRPQLPPPPLPPTNPQINHKCSAPDGVPPLEEDPAAVLRPELIGLYVRQRVLNVKQKIVAVRACVRACVAAVCVCFVCVCCCVCVGGGA